MSVTLEMDLDLGVVERNYFTVLDFLSNIGGLNAILTSFLAIMISIWHWHGLADSHLVS